MKKTLRTALFLAVISTAILPAFADDPGGTVPPPCDSISMIAYVLSLFSF